MTNQQYDFSYKRQHDYDLINYPYKKDGKLLYKSFHLYNRGWFYYHVYTAGFQGYYRECYGYWGWRALFNFRTV